MNKGSGREKRKLRLLRLLAKGNARIAMRDDGLAEITAGEGGLLVVSREAVTQAVAAGLIEKVGDELRLLADARAYLRRAAAIQEETFLSQHGEIEQAVVELEGEQHSVRINRLESPLGAIARMKDRDGSPFLSAEAMSAADRLARDFTRGQLQPRVTASWEPKIASRGSGGRGGMAELADGVIAARIAVNRAIDAMGPELAGVALDVCCFMKGLETVERERQWPARSAKLMLRTALMALSRHYAPPPRRPPGMQHWGTDDFRPQLG